MNDFWPCVGSGQFKPVGGGRKPKKTGGTGDANSLKTSFKEWMISGHVWDLGNWGMWGGCEGHTPGTPHTMAKQTEAIPNQTEPKLNRHRSKLSRTQTEPKRNQSEHKPNRSKPKWTQTKLKPNQSEPKPNRNQTEANANRTDNKKRKHIKP